MSAAAAIGELCSEDLLRMASPLREALDAAPYAPPEGSSVSIKSLVASLLPSPSHPRPAARSIREDAADFLLFCAAAGAGGEESPSPALHWVPRGLAAAAAAALEEMAALVGCKGVGEMVAAMLPDVVPALKAVVKETCVDTEGDEVVAASAKAPVEHAIVAANQFRWMVFQVTYPKLGDLCWLVIPCALTALDHWSPDVKEQGMAAFMHIAKNVRVAELSLYEDAILDACCHNIAVSDELWYHAVEVSVVLLTSTQRSNPRSPWFDRILTEMLGHLERQPLNKPRRIAWLMLIDPVLDAMGLFLLVHFRRIFFLFFQWMHVDDDKTVLLVLERLHTIVKLTWVRRSSYTERLVDELILLYKESATRTNREAIRNHILEMLALLQKCKGLQFEGAWKKHQADPDLTMLISSFSQHSLESTQLKCCLRQVDAVPIYVRRRLWAGCRPFNATDALRVEVVNAARSTACLVRAVCIKAYTGANIKCL